MTKCNKCGYDYSDSGDSTHLCVTFNMQQRTWVGIEGDEIRNLWKKVTKPDRSTMTIVTSFAKAIEAYLKQKNGYAEEKNT